jgi:nucleoside-diphosphate-sugar epimerase
MDLDPGRYIERYIEKVSLATGEVLPEPILPKQLLVQNHRDYHVVDVYARFLMSKLVDLTGNPDLVTRGMKAVRGLGQKALDAVGALAGRETSTSLGKALLGLKEKEYYFRFKKERHTKAEVTAEIERLRGEAAAQLARARTGPGGKLAVRILLTGGTGFVGKEILWQAAHDDEVAEVVTLIRAKEVRDRKTKQVVKVLTPAERGADLLKEVWLDDHPNRGKLRFVDGDIERPALGLAEEERARLRTTITHVIHCAASVAFDDPYEESFRANVLGSQNALETSLDLQRAPGSPFVAHLSIETAYIHGRQTREPAREDEVTFPRNFYNNYYELTKAMASIETDRFMLEKGLRVVQLCPAIVIGEYRTGNNRGDTKVVNAPVNLFGRAREALVVGTAKGGLTDRSKAWMIAKLALVFPGDATAELNLVTVDRVVLGILAATKTERAIGERVHLATDNRVTGDVMLRTIQEELGVDVTLAEPTIHRNVTLPVLTSVLNRLEQPKLAGALGMLSSIFGGYSEWGQPVHVVENDVKVLSLPLPRPNTHWAFRMLCRHNRFVQEFGKVKDAAELSRRERVWRDFVQDLERRTGKHAGALTAAEFRKAMDEEVDPIRFERRKRKPAATEPAP